MIAGTLEIVRNDKPVSVLLRLHPGYGLGDAVQMTSVVQHLRKYRPDWVIDYVADRGRHSAMIGHVHWVTSDIDNFPKPPHEYDRDITIQLYDTFAAWPDRPNTRVTSCLHERFGMGWDSDCGQYKIHVQSHARLAMRDFLVNEGVYSQGKKIVGVHYLGDSSPTKKNLTTYQARVICAEIERLGRVPLLLDWRDKSSLANEPGIFTTGRHPKSDTWGGCAQMNAAILEQCEAFVGVDSGPGKVATAIDMPALIVWTGHHPALFHDPAPKTTHLVPDVHEQLQPMNGDATVLRFFRQNYDYFTYQTDPVAEVTNWLRDTLH